MIACLLLLPALATAAEIDEIGGRDTYNNDGEMMKLVVLSVQEAAAVTEFEFAVYNARSEGDVTMVLYEAQADGSFALVDARAAQDLPQSDQGWASTGPVAWLLEPGGTYAMGVWIASDWYYYYDQRQSGSPWFGRVEGSFRVRENVPETFTADVEGYYYWTRVTSEDADVDGDGIVADTFGGADCDDLDPTVGTGEEIPYDGIDQDCVGGDLVDVDGDGEAALEAGGGDCDDADAAVLPGVADACGDGLDADCDGEDPACDGPGDSGDGGGGDGGGDSRKDGAIEIEGGCGCATGGGAAPGLVGLLAALGAWRRRRP